MKTDPGPEPTTHLSTSPSSATLNLAKTNSAKGSIRGKLKRARWDNSFLAALILQVR